MAKLTVPILALFLCACSSDDDAADASLGETPRDADTDSSDDGGAVISALPDTLLLDGTAEAQDGDDRVECRFFGMLTDLVRAPNGEISGFFIGEIFRTTFTGGGQFEFAPLVGGEATIKPIEGEQIELRFVGDQPDDALEFWLELEVLTGDDDGRFNYGGEWSCAPGLLGDPGFMDIDLTAPGTWTLVPE